MTWYRVCLACAVSVALMACTEAKQGVLQPQGPLAGLRYVSLVNDTGAVDFRIINFIGDAPSAGAVTFRTGGQPYGLSTNFLPPHWKVEAGRDVHIRVFMNGLDPAVSSLVVFDTTCTFAEGVNYTFFLYGKARGAAVHALVTVDTLPAPAAGQIAVRAINLAPSLAGASPTLADTTVLPDVWLKAPDAAIVSPFSGTAIGSALAYRGITPYRGVAAGTYWIGTSATGSTNPIGLFTTAAGTAGTVTVNPVAGTNVAGSAITLVVVPRSVPSSMAPQTGAAPRTALSVTRSNDSVTLQTGYLSTWVRRTVDSSGTQVPRADTVVSASAVNVPHGVTAASLVSVGGAIEAGYNGWQLVTALADTTVCIPVDSLVDLRTSCTTLNPASPPRPNNVIVRNVFRFRYRITGTPASPATGTVIVRGPHTVTDHTIPALIALIDRKPVLTAP